MGLFRPKYNLARPPKGLIIFSALNRSLNQINKSEIYRSTFVNIIFCTAILYSVFSILYKAYSLPCTCTVQCELYTVKCKAQWSKENVECTAYNVNVQYGLKCTVYSLYCTFYSTVMVGINYQNVEILIYTVQPAEQKSCQKVERTAQKTARQTH